MNNGPGEQTEKRELAHTVTHTPMTSFFYSTLRGYKVGFSSGSLTKGRLQRGPESRSGIPSQGASLDPGPGIQREMEQANSKGASDPKL